MVSLSKYSFRARLIAGFGIVIILNVLLNTSSLIKIKKNHTTLKLIYNHPLVVSNATREINSAIYAIHREMKDVVLSKNKTEFNKYLKNIEVYDKKIKDNYKIIRDKFLGDQNTVKKAELMYLNWEPIRNEVIGLVKNNNFTPAINITRTKGEAYVESLLKKNQIMIDFAKQKADQLYTDNLTKAKQSKTLLSLLLTTIAVISLFIALVISNSISKPINKLIFKIKENKTINIEDPLKNLPRTEQGMLELAVAELEESHKKATNFNAKLKLKVDEKTKALTDINKNLQDMVYIASHDLQIPLVSMVGYTTELLEDYKNDLNKEAVFCLTRIQVNAQRMHKLVLSLLDISRLDTHTNPYREFSLSEIIDKILKDLSLTIETAKATITPHKLPKIYADKQRIESVFRNLILNALNYGGKKIEIGLLKGILFVKDDGMGIPTNQLGKIFNPGERLKMNNAEGVGMGLTFCKKVIGQHKGRIWASSEGVNKGTTIHINLENNILKT
ncbi:MAG: MCP four helix bundle domain-containing protein [Flavobacteriaceae bacterium]|nr:MCP four helix bundle domain-containing protein [Flavobacteriaceae bacterium]